MQKVLYTNEMETCSSDMDDRVVEHIRSGQVVTFEGMAEYDLLAFDWYDVSYAGTDTSRILIYLDREDLLFFCEDKKAYEKVRALLPEGEGNERMLYRFFLGLLQEDLTHLEQYEGEITDAEDAALKSSRRDYLDKIVEYRKELLRLKRYYEQLDAILDNLTANDNGLLTEDAVRHLAILANRTERYRGSVLNLRDYVTQMREAYQSQIDIEQNNLMRIFTVITAVFCR